MCRLIAFSIASLLTMDPPEYGSAQAGFTFNEILVSIHVIIIAVLGYAASTVLLLRGGSTSDIHTAAIHLAHDKMEELQSTGAVANVDNCLSAPERTLTISSGLADNFERCWTISDWAIGSKLKHVTVTISWRDREQRHLSVSTLVLAE